MNDDQLTADLHDAFRRVTADLVYDGDAPRLRRSPLYAVPVTAVAAGVAAAALVPSLAASPTAPLDGRPVETARPTDPAGTSVAAPSRTVVQRVAFAGQTFTATRDGATQGRLVARDVGTLPEDAVEVETTTPAKAWFGTQPVTGDPALFVQIPTRYDGSIFSLSGPGWTPEQLVAVLEGGEPQVVPHVE